MAANSGIEWTDATWNCLAGCEAISPGCANCYAATMTRRLEAMGQADYAGLTTAKHFNGKVRCLPDKLSMPMKRRKPTTYFVNSMSDLFHEDVPDEFIDRVFAVMALCPQHTFQVLTKRAERMQQYCAGWPAQVKRSDIAHRVATACGAMRIELGPAADAFGLLKDWPLPNVQLGVSAEDQPRADERIPWLLKTPAAVRFVSAEPLLGPIKLPPGLDWVIAGGESGHGSRPCDTAWIRKIVLDCKISGVPCFVKQLGGHVEATDGIDPIDQFPNNSIPRFGNGSGYNTARIFLKDKKGGDPAEWPLDLRVREFPLCRSS